MTRERPKLVAWLEVLAIAEFGLSLAQIIFDGGEEALLWPELLVATMLLLVALWFTRIGVPVARWALMVLHGLTIFAASYVLYAYSEYGIGELKWMLAYLLISLASLSLLFSRQVREWSRSQVAREVDRETDRE